MSFFSKSRKNQPSTETPSSLPEQPTPTPEEPTPWAMGKEEYEELKGMLNKTLSNLDVVDHNVRLIISRLDTLQSDMRVSLRNDQLIERYFHEVQEDLRQIKRAVNN